MKIPTDREVNYARGAVQNALITGKLTKQPCQVCGTKRAEAHHPDYTKPLDVVWLCKKHHTEEHVKWGWRPQKGITLNIRDFPKELALKLKLEAINRSTSMRGLVIEKLSDGEIAAPSTWGIDRRIAEIERKIAAGEDKCLPTYNSNLKNLAKLAERVPGKKKPTKADMKSALTESPAGSVTTGMEEQGTVEANYRGNVMIDPNTGGYTLPGAIEQPDFCEHGRDKVTCLICDWARRNQK